MMMEHSHSPMMHMIKKISWVVTALASINMLTGLYGCDFFAWMMNSMPGMVVPMVWIVGICGMISLAMLIKVCMHHE
ncbi:MAG TPA: hypothetical protein VHX42_02555 [Candidatus Babeliales bacterium]|jgi:uncharacterized membrane protein YuzA (DUF378 family)|nr:hypothetical protein [Candidatus Babeliales bacterium]